MQGELVDGKGEMWHSLAHHTIMFSLLADKLDNTFRRLRGLGKISEKNIADALRDIRLALLEADVEFGVAREFIGRVKERAMGQEVLKSIKPGEQIVKIFRDEIAALLGGDSVGLDLTDPARIMVVGLNGAGKTTTSAKLALRLKNEGRRPLLVACDLVRPAAVDQLATLAEQIGVPVYKPAPGSRDVVAVAREALEWARTHVYSVLHYCWGAQAGLYYYYDVPKKMFPQKLCGIYPYGLTVRNHPLLRGFDDRYFIPQSRYTTVDDAKVYSTPDLQVLSRSVENGINICATADMRRIFVMGHFEYDRMTLRDEYVRDRDKGLNPSLPKHYYPTDDTTQEPLFKWCSYAHLFYLNWLNVVYQDTPYDLHKLTKRE